MPDHLIVRANASRGLPLADNSVHCCVTSPPYWSLRDYGVEGQLGLEASPEEYVANQVAVFREVRRVLRPDASLWLNIGDTFYSDKGAPGIGGQAAEDARQGGRRFGLRPADRVIDGLKRKDLVGIPWLLALALRADGWHLRSEVLWSKTNCMPESVRDRPSRSHEQVFLLTKTPKYYYDEVIERVPQKTLGRRHEGKSGYREGHPSKGGISSRQLNPLGGAVRSVWSLSSKGYKGAHFATMPPALAERCIRLGSSARGVCPACGSPWRQVIERTRRATRPGNQTKVGRASSREDSPYAGHGGTIVGNRDPQRHTTDVSVLGWESSCTCREPSPVPSIILDPYGGAMTTARAAQCLGRSSVSTELSADYIAIGQARLAEPVPVDRPPGKARAARATAVPIAHSDSGGRRPLFPLDL